MSQELDTVPNSGSSPHAWRTQNSLKSYAGIQRIISTCVENTIDVKKEHKKERGSSPHAWRTHSTQAYEAIVPGIISTCVENTLKDP